MIIDGYSSTGIDIGGYPAATKLLRHWLCSILGLQLVFCSALCLQPSACFQRFY